MAASSLRRTNPESRASWSEIPKSVSHEATAPSAPEVAIRPGQEPTPETRRTGLWLFGGHVGTVWAIALSNAFFGLGVLFTLHRRLPLPWRRAAPLLYPLIFYVICFVASALGSVNPAVSLQELTEIFSLLTLVLALYLVRGEENVRRLFDGLMAVIALLAVYGIVQNYVGGYGTLDRRVPGLFSHYQTFAGVLLVGNLLLVVRLTTGEGRRPWHYLAFGVVSWALLLTLTRGAWVAFGCTLAIYGLLRARRHFVPLTVAGTLFLALFFTFAPDAWTSRMRSIVDLADSSNYDRLCMADAALYMIGERPLLGIGPEMVRHLYPFYRHPTAPRFHVTHLHNTFLQIAAEQGLLSLLAYLWLMAAGLALAWRGYRRLDSQRDLHLGVILVLVGFNLAGLFEDNWRDTEVQRLVLFLLAVPVCLDDSEVDGLGEGEAAEL